MLVWKSQRNMSPNYIYWSVSIKTALEELTTLEATSLISLKKNFFWVVLLALDEFTDSSDIANTALLIWGANTEFEMMEKLTSMNSMSGTTTGKNIFKEGLPWRFSG